jgi:phosphatidylserine/phosphatidylglycerophosphate/cardiolipin synthase-like enzyme
MIKSELIYGTFKFYRAENSIIQRLLRFGIKRPSDFITFHSLRNHANLDGHPVSELIYVHSKLMIVDDKTVISECEKYLFIWKFKQMFIFFINSWFREYQ